MKTLSVTTEFSAYWWRALKFFFVFFSTYFLFITTSTAGWVAKTSNTTLTLNAVHAINKDTVIVVGEMGKIRRTVNGGQTAFDTIYAGKPQHLVDVVFVSPSTGYTARDSGVIKTTDYGATWASVLNNSGKVYKLTSISYDKASVSSVYSFSDYIY